MKLADMQDLGSCAARRKGSSPFGRTNIKDHLLGGLLCCCDRMLDENRGNCTAIRAIRKPQAFVCKSLLRAHQE